MTGGNTAHTTAAHAVGDPQRGLVYPTVAVIDRGIMLYIPGALTACCAPSSGGATNECAPRGVFN